jgi:TatA/E family protein of Tat protein translocase
MFGVGYQEMLLIGLAALLLFGPGKLPEVMSQAGKFYKQFRDVTDELSGEFNKTVAEAKGELDAMGVDLGPMQQQVDSITKSVQKDLGGAAGKKTTSTGKKSTSSSGAKKSTGSSSSRSTTAGKSGSKATSTRTSSSGSKATTSTKKATDSRATTSAHSAGKPIVVASKDDPFAGVSLFEPAERKPKRRARAATPSAFTDLTPRDEPASEEPQAAATASEPVAPDSNDPVARARQRRMKAGYAQATA